MKDKELDRQLNKMQDIEPRSEWVQETENDIIGSPSRNVLSIFQFSFTRYATVAILIMAMIFGGVMLYQNDTDVQPSPEVSKVEIKNLVSALQELSYSIDEMVEIKHLNNEAGQKVLNQGKQVAEAVDRVTKNQELDPQTEKTVSSLQSDLKRSTENLEQKLYYQEAKRKLELFKDQQENGILTEEKKKKIKEIEDLMRAEKYEQALLKLERISQ